jgi:hypothetical protein
MIDFFDRNRTYFVEWGRREPVSARLLPINPR